MPTSATHRLKALLKHTAPNETQRNAQTSKGTQELVLVLPRGGRVAIIEAISPGGPTTLTLNNDAISMFAVSEYKTSTFPVSSINTRYHDAPTSHLPAYPLITLTAPPARSIISIENLWTTIYALFSLYHDDENIPMVFSSIANADDLLTYLISSGLGQRSRSTKSDALFLSRSTFWQGAGTTGYHTHSWHLAPPPSPFPSIVTFTRNEKVIASHLLRPPKPAPGTVLYRRWCNAVQQSIEIAFFDIDGVADNSESSTGTGVSRHMAAFHKWHNDERVNSAWGERGSLEVHRTYVEGVLADPHVWPCMLSWDGELMGYAEIVYTKEDHVAAHYPTGIVPGDWERGLHVLAGESKFVGNGRAEIWLRSLVHYCFLADPRTERVMGEPNQGNLAIQKTCLKAGYHVESVFDFPYKRSTLVLNPRGRFFGLCNLR
ncbi:hypothetical protein D9619_011583 [Psilocybe cf. subviscida]|uniref:Acyltransferase MbtK/IucB-like conserved domain-containing protein n=1 Tax=Psilocybe cf. subviscida TaxID=2480587 RepID=A0A8H5BSI1_9AGAR|nr:hypothetical protein D9619_011583 [Psilocybe cf. subviscida]